MLLDDCLIQSRSGGASLLRSADARQWFFWSFKIYETYPKGMRSLEAVRLRPIPLSNQIGQPVLSLECIDFVEAFNGSHWPRP